MSRQPNHQVRKRRVFYIPGFDPIHPRRYRELYRKEGADQAAISGYLLDISGKQPGSDIYGWNVNAAMDGAEIEAEVDVLVWSDIVRHSMSTSIALTYVQMVRTAWIYISSGALRRLMKLRKGPVIAALYPIGIMVVQLLLAVLVGVAVARGSAALAGFAPVATRGFSVFVSVLSLGLGLASVAWVMRWFRAQDGKIYAYYLLHNYAFSTRLYGANPPELEGRIKEFVHLIAAALDEDVDEVLVVGHSSGAHVGVSVLADLIRSGKRRDDGPALGFLSVGHVMPMVSFLPRAFRLRGDLQYLSARDDVTWVDVSAPGDGCAFALCDPVTVSGVAPEGKKWPLVFSAAFTKTLSPERWAELRWRFFRLHFQYLCAFDKPGDYDYFRITAGPQTLATRYAGRKASGSRIDHAVSKFTSVAP